MTSGAHRSWAEKELADMGSVFKAYFFCFGLGFPLPFAFLFRFFLWRRRCRWCRRRIALGFMTAASAFDAKSAAKSAANAANRA